MTTQCVVRAARGGVPLNERSEFWGFALTEARSKTEIKNSVLRRSDETQSCYPHQSKRDGKSHPFFVIH